MARIPAAQRRQDFIRAAVEVIASHGIDGATTRRIAEQAEANLAMLHYCYDSKEDLFADVFEYVTGKYREVIEDSDPHTTLSETGQAILRGVMQCYVDSPSFTATTFELVNWARRQHGDRGIAVYDQALESLRKALQESADNSVAPPVIDEMAYVLATLADGFGVNWLTYGDASVAREQMDVNCAVLDAWLSSRTAAVPAKPTRRKRAAGV
ncbi:TetR/AcrR family transcriptional regulator [Nocardioides eburneiflavus]|uniref:TetR/AcrR family transcriptional regulator n=1 Tax=Nocardioides eburneiflavus TaxID=2518372 RepID=A0A4Z1BTZ8_9ACTN|nr:TetR/AcrR family transcriptional regulator [Nocardioides eburneiflavus]TGN64721.1 TetR/AcrR family transcriptional regulator [Nocardioides eburneiflavus]